MGVAGSLSIAGVAGLGVVRSIQAQAPEPVPPHLKGEALADALGLEQQATMPQDCRSYVEINDGFAGYCLHDFANSLERWEIARRLRGYDVTDLDREFFAVSEELSSAESPERLEELTQRLGELRDRGALGGQG